MLTAFINALILAIIDFSSKLDLPIPAWTIPDFSALN